MARTIPYPPGIRPSGNGLRIRLWQKGKVIHSETIPCDPCSKSSIKSAVKRREYLTSKLTLGLSLNENHETENKTFIQAAQEYLNTLDAKYSTQISYENILNSCWIPYFKNWIITDINSKDIKTVLSDFNVSPKTKRNRLIPLAGIFKNEELSNPCALIKIKNKQKPPVERYTPQEREKLINKLTGQAQVYFAVLFGCGLRPGEALALTWADYDKQYFNINKQIVRSRIELSTKTSVRRKVYVPGWVKFYLDKHPTIFTGEWIFTNAKGKHYANAKPLNLHWQEVHRKLRIPYRVPYVCRHTRAAELLSTGIEPARASKQLGHSLEMFFRIYAEFIDEYCKSHDNSDLEGYHRQFTAKNKGAKK